MLALPGQVAQLVEQRIENPRVGGSIPSLATKNKKTKSPAFASGFLLFQFAIGGPNKSTSLGRPRSPRR